MDVQGGGMVRLNARQRRTLRRAEERVKSTSAALQESVGQQEEGAVFGRTSKQGCGQTATHGTACDSTNSAKPQERLSRFAPPAP